MPVLLIARTPGPLRRYFGAFALSTLGGSMAYVAVLLVALDRSGSGLAVTAVLLAELLPVALAGALFGSFADRYSRRVLMVIADVLGGVAFVGLAFSDGIAPTIAFAVLAGFGVSLFMPTSKAAIGALAGDQTDEAMGASVTIFSASMLAGPAIGAGVLLFASAETLLMANAASFLISAVVIWGLPLDREPRRASGGETDEDEGDRRRSVRDGWRAMGDIRGLRLVVVLGASTALSLSMVNVAEPLLATGPLNAGAAGFSALIACFGIGAVGGSLAGRAQMGRFIGAVIACGVVLVMIGLAPSLLVAAPLMALAGYLDGVMSSSDQRLIADMTEEDQRGQAFGVKHSLDASGVVVGFLLGGVLATASGPRPVFWVSGAVTAVFGVFALVRSRALRDAATNP